MGNTERMLYKFSKPPQATITTAQTDQIDSQTDTQTDSQLNANGRRRIRTKTKKENSAQIFKTLEQSINLLTPFFRGETSVLL